MKKYKICKILLVILAIFLCVAFYEGTLRNEIIVVYEQVSTFFWDEAPQHGLEMREGQQDMSFEIVDALINDLHFAIEAGVGIGKSFGYLGQGFSTRSGFLQS